MATKLASGYIDLTVRYGNAFDELVRDAEKAGDEAERRLRRKFARGVEIDVDADTSEAEAKIDRASRDRDATINVDADTGRAENQIDRLSGGRSRRVRMDVDINIGSAASQLSKLDSAISGVLSSLKTPLGAVGILGSLPTLAYGVAEVTASLKQLAQAGLVIPGIMAGIGASFGTLLGGLTGISDAMDAISAANAEASSSTKSASSAASSARSAHQSLRNAVVDEKRARDDLNDAIEEAEDNLKSLQSQMRGGVTDEKRAVLEHQKAVEALASGDYTDRRDALLRVEETENNVLDVRERNAQKAEELAEAQAKGVRGADNVVAANENLTRSQQSVANAQDQVTESANQTTAAQDKMNQALGGLSPNAQAMARTLVGIKDGPLKDLRNNISQTMLEGIPQGLENLVAQAMPILNSGTQKIAVQWNALIKELFGQLGSDEAMGTLDRIMTNTSAAMERLRPALKPIVDAILSLTGTGSDFLPRMADAFTDLATKLSTWITEAEKSGKLKEWIDQGLSAIGDLGAIAVNIAKIVGSFADAADGNFLTWLREVTAKWAEWMGSEEGQAKIKEFINSGKEALNKWLPTIQDIIRDLPQIIESCRKVLNLLIDIFGWLNDKIPGGIATVVVAFAAFKTIAGITSLIANLGTIMGFLGPSGSIATGATAAAGGITTAFSALGTIVVPVTLSIIGGQAIAEWIANEVNKHLPGSSASGGDLNVPPWHSVVTEQPKRLWEMITGERDINTGLPRAEQDRRDEYEKNARAAAPYRAHPMTDIPDANAKPGDVVPPGTRGAVPMPGKNYWVIPELFQDPTSTSGWAWRIYQPPPAPNTAPGREPDQGPLPASAPPPAPAPSGAPAPAPTTTPSGYTGTPYSDAGLVPGLAAVNDIIAQNFPGIRSIGGQSNRPAGTPQWHTQGRALDIGIGPSTAGGANPEGKALGDRIWAWMQSTGVFDMNRSLWQQKDHFDHIHAQLKEEFEGQSNFSNLPGGGAGQMSMPAGTVPVFVTNWPGSGVTSPGGTGGATGGIGGTPFNIGGSGGSGGGATGPSLWDQVMPHEGGTWDNQDTGGSGHFGGLQFSPDTWRLFGGVDLTGKTNPAEATREQQIEIANRTAFGGYNGTPPQGLKAWEAITNGSVPGVTADTPQSSFMPTTTSTTSPTVTTPTPGTSDWQSYVQQGVDTTGSRTEGYKPAGAGSSAASGGDSFLAGIYKMGAGVINTAIDQAASVASSAAGMGVNAIAPGAGGVASGAASTAIGLGTEALKRGVDYGADMLGIWTDALIEQVSPFGVPRFVSTDPTAFMPEGMTEALTTSVEKAAAEVFKKPDEEHKGTGALPGPVDEHAGTGAAPGPGPGGEPAPQEGGDTNIRNTNVTLKDDKEFYQYQKQQETLDAMTHSGRP